MIAKKNVRAGSKAQVMGQVFVYVFASIIFVIVLIYGYNAIGKFKHQQDTVAMIELKTKIKSEIYSIASTRSIRRLTLHMPTSTQKLCFIDLRKNPRSGITPGICNQNNDDYNPQICSSWQDNVSKNVFLIPSINLQLNVGDISLYKDSGGNDGYLCINVTREVVYIELEGLGDSTSIKRWVPVS